MNYALSAVTMLNKLGYDQPTGREWLEKLKKDKNICPVTVKKEPLYVLCSGDDFMEVISRAMQKKPKATNEELITALNCYLQTGNCL